MTIVPIYVGTCDLESLVASGHKKIGSSQWGIQKNGQLTLVGSSVTLRMSWALRTST